MNATSATIEVDLSEIMKRLPPRTREVLQREAVRREVPVVDLILEFANQKAAALVASNAPGARAA